MRSFPEVVVIIAASACVLAAQRLPSSSYGARPGHTGGFGEPTCRACHSDYPLNEGAAVVVLDSLPATYEPGRTYSLRLRVQHPELQRGGFQISARFEDGVQAGVIQAPDTTLLRLQPLRGVSYLSQTAVSSRQVQGDSIAWRFEWVAPAAARRVVFNVAVNVANDDASEFGDRIYTKVFYAAGDSVKK